MPWIEVDEPHAAPPRVRPVEPSGRWSPPLELDRGWAELVGVAVDRTSGFDPAGCSELSLVDSVLDGLAGTEPGLELDAARSEIVDGDLSQIRVRSLVATRVVGCKLTGTDLSGASLRDVVFERCSFRYANLRMAKLERVRFVDCTLDEVDAFELQATDVELPGSRLDEVNIDRLRATRLDLRGAETLALTGVGSLAGCLVAEHQVPALAWSLIHAVGADLERSDPGETERSDPDETEHSDPDDQPVGERAP